MKIGVIGLGVIGSAVRDGLAGLGHELLVHDTKLPGSELSAVLASDLCFICVPTPQGEGGRCDTSIVESVARELHAAGYAGAIVVKSTVTPGTTARLATELGRSIAFCPEFLRERYALQDFTANHDVCVIGTDDDGQEQLLRQAHGSLPKVFARMTPTEAELSKYFSNVINALRITFANQFYDVCAALGADYAKVKAAMVQRSTIEDSYLDCSPTQRGFGGPCLPKDAAAFAALVDDLGLDLKLFRTIVDENAKYPRTVPPGMRA